MNPKNYFKSGQVLIFMLFFVTVALLFCGTAIDIGMINLSRQRMQTVADAAALAAAKNLPNETNLTAIAAANGFTNGVNGVNISYVVKPDGIHDNWIQVRIAKPYSFIFGKLIGLQSITLRVVATAQCNTNIPLSINMGNIYGQNSPVVTLVIDGPSGRYEDGDLFSVPKKDDGSINDFYKPDGYNYRLYVPSNWITQKSDNLVVEIFDPEDWSTYDNTDSSRSIGNTVYSLYAPDNTPTIYSDDILIATFIAKPSVHTYNNKWYAPPGWSNIKVSTYGTGMYRINVKTLSGSSHGNGFSLRAGDSITGFDPNNGTKICAEGPLPIRFQTNGTAGMALGYVPKEVAGKQLRINKFDTDIGSTSCKYTCDSLSGQQFPGVLAGNGKMAEDVITLPTSYTGGIWYVNYAAGAGDISCWWMSYDGISTDQNDQTAKIFLVE